MYCASGSLRPEPKHRAGQVWQSLSKAEKQFYRSSQVSQEQRRAVLRVLILPRVLHNAGTWPKLSREEIADLSRPIVRVLRLIGGYEYKYGVPLVPDHEVYSKMGFDSVESLVAEARLRAQ